MQSWKRKLRMGQVGGGQGAFIGAVHRIAAELDMQVETVAGTFSRDFDNTKTTGEQLYLQPSRCYETYQQMAETEANLPDDERIDFVSIVTPNQSHHDICKCFLEHGFHVVCDKPITTTVAEAESLVQLVEKSGLVFGLTHNYTGTPMVRQAKHLFESGQMGQVRKVVMMYLQDFFMHPFEKEGMKQAVWRMDANQAGKAGALADVGSHCINLLEYVTGDPVVELCADKSTFLPDRTLDEDVNILLRFKGGGKGVMALSQIACGEENGFSMRVYTSEGSIHWEQENPNYLDVKHFGKPWQTFTRAQGYNSDAANSVSRIPPGHPEGFIEAFANIYNGVTEAIRAHIDGKPKKPEEYNFPTVYDGLREMVFIEKVLESCEKGSVWVKL